MEFNSDKAKGVLDRSFPAVKVPLHKDCLYDDLVEKCNMYGMIHHQSMITILLMALGLLLVRNHFT